MNIADTILLILVGILYVGIIATCIIVGKKWSKGQWLSLIAGHNATTKSEKDKYDVSGLLKFMSIVAYINALFLCFFAPIIYLVFKFNAVWLIYFLIVFIFSRTCNILLDLMFRYTLI